ncbi:MAG: hypothetical protein JST00_25780 [Deltaproteobacteria bacterium]|nr:hypothetical protein [Deltaproteobacteria bacterium]
MSESRPNTMKLNRTHLLVGRKPALASTYVVQSLAAQQQRTAAPAPAPAAQAQVQVQARPANVLPTPPIKACVPTADPRLVMLADPTSDRAAAFREMRDTLITKNMLPRMLAVSSAQAGEGKTTCAINLAMALAEHGNEKVLLLDACFEKPAIGGILGVDHTAPSWFKPFVVSSLSPSLHVATLTPEASQSYLDISTFTRALGMFHRAGYQRIVMDAPCVLDAMQVLSLAGGVLLTTRAGASRQHALRKAVEKVGAKRCVGVMLHE